MGDCFFGNINDPRSMFLFMDNNEINLDLTLAPPMVDEQAAPPVVEGQQPPVIADVFPERGELEGIIQRLSRRELREIIGEDTISQPLEALSAEQKTALLARASLHWDKKNEILDLISSLYPERPWEHSRLIREKFFLTTGEKELDLSKLDKIIHDLSTKKKACSWAHELNHRLENWNWKQ